MFLQAGSPAELRAYMAQYPDSRCIAGGTDIMPVQNRENDHEAVFIDISGAAALHPDRVGGRRAVRRGSGDLRRDRTKRAAAAVRAGAVPCRITGGVPSDTKSGHHRRQCGTWEPRSGHPAVLAMLDAEVRLYSATEGTCRDIPVDTFITGPGQTLLRPGEYIEALRFSPRRRAGAWPMKKWDGAMR